MTLIAHTDGTATQRGMVIGRVISCSSTDCVYCDVDNRSTMTTRRIIVSSRLYEALAMLGVSSIERSLEIPLLFKATTRARPERFGWSPPVRQWHRRRAQTCAGRSVYARLPRGLVRAWRSLKEKRRAWGIG